MAFFKRELSPVERFESTLRDRRAQRQKQADRVSVVEAIVDEKRAVAERLAVAGAASDKLGRAETNLRAVEERAKAMRAELAEFDEQIASTERAVADAKAQRDRDMLADQIEEMAAAIERAAPGFGASANAFVDAVTKSATTVLEATRFSTSVDAVSREVLAAADLICWQLRSAAVRTRAGNANIAVGVAAELEQLPTHEIDRQLIYTLNPLLWRAGGEVRRVPAFALVDDRVEGDRRLAGLPVADDQLALTPADGGHRVDGLDAGLHRLLDGLTRHDVRGLQLELTPLRRGDLALAVERAAQRVDHSAEEAVADRDRQDVARAANLLTLLDALRLAEDDAADLADVEVERDAQEAALELEKLVGHRGVEALDSRDAVTGVRHDPDLVARGLGVVGGDETLQGLANLLRADAQLGHYVLHVSIRRGSGGRPIGR